MTDAVIFVEEESARIVVSSIASRLFPRRIFVVIGHDGKSDLEESFPRKIRAWKYPGGLPFIILRDNDGGNCSALKTRITSLVPDAAIARTRVRIIMQCLEGWYLGDIPALVSAGLIKKEMGDRLTNSAKYREPEKLTNAKELFFNLHNERGQLTLAQAIAPHLDINTNRCKSFQLFVQTLRSLVSP